MERTIKQTAPVEQELNIAQLLIGSQLIRMGKVCRLRADFLAEEDTTFTLDCEVPRIHRLVYSESRLGRTGLVFGIVMRPRLSLSTTTA